MLHIQTHIVDLFPDKENIITTRLLVPSRDVGCLEGKDGSFSHIKKQTGANVQILPREQLPTCVFGAHELVQVCFRNPQLPGRCYEVLHVLGTYLNTCNWNVCSL